MIKITPIPLSNMSINTKGIIRDFSSPQNPLQSNEVKFRLQTMGIIAGREILIIKKNFGSVLARVENDFPLAIRNSIANTIMVKPLCEQPQNMPKEKTADILKLLLDFLKH